MIKCVSAKKKKKKNEEKTKVYLSNVISPLKGIIFARKLQILASSVFTLGYCAPWLWLEDIHQVQRNQSCVI